MILTLLSQLLLIAAANCNQNINPHSFDCVEETFFGKHFPVLDATEDRVLGVWKFLTVATPEGSSTEFLMLQNKKNPHIPEGVLNKSDQSTAGPLVWESGRLQFQNWKSDHADVESNSLSARDRWTSQSIFPTQDGKMSLQCRIFDRNGADHLLCLWFEKTGDSFKKRGYLGFLKNN